MIEITRKTDLKSFRTILELEVLQINTVVNQVNLECNSNKCKETLKWDLNKTVETSSSKNSVKGLTIISWLCLETWRTLFQKQLASSSLESLRILYSLSFTIKWILIRHYHQPLESQRELLKGDWRWPQSRRHWKILWKYFKEIQILQITLLETKSLRWHLDNRLRMIEGLQVQHRIQELEVVVNLQWEVAWTPICHKEAVCHQACNVVECLQICREEECLQACKDMVHHQATPMPKVVEECHHRDKIQINKGLEVHQEEELVIYLETIIH